jgi:hypothetical protein
MENKVTEAEMKAFAAAMKAKLEDPDAGYARQPGSEFIEKAADGGDGRFFLTSFCAEIIGKNDGTAAENVMSAWLFSKAPYDKESIGTLMRFALEKGGTLADLAMTLAWHFGGRVMMGRDFDAMADEIADEGVRKRFLLSAGAQREERR